MSADLLILIKLSACFLALFGIAELLYHVFRVAAEYTRKMVHVGTGLLCLLFPLYLHQLWQVALICAAFLLLLALSKKFNFLRSVNAIERRSEGSILYPVIITVIFGFYVLMNGRSFVFDPLIYFYLPA